MEWGYQQIFPCVVSSFMVVDGPWDPGLHLNLTRDIYVTPDYSYKVWDISLVFLALNL